MTIFQEFHDFVNKYKNVHRHGGLIEAEPVVAVFLLFACKNILQLY